MASSNCECPLCRARAWRSEADERYAGKGVAQIQCGSCGTYLITPDAESELQKSWDPFRRAKLSWVTRERWEQGKQPIPYCASRHPAPGGQPVGVRLDELESTHAPTSPLQGLDRALLNLYRRSRYFGHTIEVEGNRDWPLLFAGQPSIAGSILKYMIESGLLIGKGNSQWVLTVKGLERCRELEQTPSESRQGFVAMWFDPETDEAWEQGLKPAIEESGYEAYRVDMDPSTERIDARIISEIRKSHFVVVDGTGQRTPVYFEAGFAMGLHLPVIFTCRKDWLERCCFDTRQYPHVVWTTAQELKQELVVRIGANIGSLKRPAALAE